MGNIQWNRPRGEVTNTSIEQFQRRNNIKFPNGYIRLILEYNGARPDKKYFDIEGYKKEAVFNSLLNWDENRKGNIKAISAILADKKLIPFADDPFGNYICFDYEKNDMEPSIKYYDHERDEIFLICKTFEIFIEMLY